ncbi:MAG TPA: hypothetical protein VLQ48_00085 [Chloroflexia bacterium]|nr:hypothetical protein [Chloroflexia bacterium]
MGITFKHYGYGGLLLLGLMISALLSYTGQAAPLATVSRCNFTPTQGGPGTLVHVQLDQWYSSSVTEVGFAVPITPGASLGETFPSSRNLKLIDYPLASMETVDGHGEATFRIPSKLSSGGPLPRENLYLVCVENDQISMGGGAGPALFTFTAGSLPITGQSTWVLWVLLAVIGVALIIGGVRLWQRPQGSP